MVIKKSRRASADSVEIQNRKEVFPLLLYHGEREKAMAFYEKAEAKLEKGKAEKLDRYGEAMKSAVVTALLEFCRQDDEFAQAVAQGGSVKDCMAAVGKEVKGGSISDMEAYGAAVRFFFPGAGIHVEMSIDLCDSVKKTEEKAGVVIDLTAFF